MARRRSKVRDRRKPKRRLKKKKLTLEQMLSRVPDTKWLTTKQVMHVFNDCHGVTVYRYVQQDKLTRHRRFGGPANYYKRDGVVALVRAHFRTRLTSNSEIRDSAGKHGGKRSKKPNRSKKPKRRVR